MLNLYFLLVVFQKTKQSFFHFVKIHLLQHCFQRLTPIFDTRNIIVLTNAGYADIVRENLPELPADNVIAEPAVRDTAGTVALAATARETPACAEGWVRRWASRSERSRP